MIIWLFLFVTLLLLQPVASFVAAVPGKRPLFLSIRQLPICPCGVTVQPEADADPSAPRHPHWLQMVRQD